MNISVQRIVDLIKEKGINEKVFLMDIGLNITALSDWKSGRSKSYKKHISQIADYFNVSTDYLLGKTDDPNLPQSSGVTVPDDFVAMARKSEGVSEEHRAKLYKVLDSTIDAFLENYEKENEGK